MTRASHPATTHLRTTATHAQTPRVSSRCVCMRARCECPSPPSSSMRLLLMACRRWAFVPTRQHRARQDGGEAFAAVPDTQVAAHVHQGLHGPEQNMQPLRGVPWPPVPARGKSGGAEACPARGSVLAVPVHVRPHRCTLEFPTLQSSSLIV